MKKTLILLAFVMLTAFTGRSQDTTSVKIPFWMAKEIAFDLNELDYLRVESTVNTLQLAKYEELVKSLQDLSEKKDQQIVLKSKLAENWRVQYEAEKAKKPKNTIWEKIGIGAGAFLVGFFFASVK